MKVRAIMFRPVMVRATLAGLKTETRRLAWAWEDGERHGKASPWQKCKPGDLAWVREDWAKDDLLENGARYYATDDIHELRTRRPAMYMPRWASRLTLEVTEVRLERLQDITEKGAIAEGAEIDPMHPSPIDGGPMVATKDAHIFVTPCVWYRELWNSIHTDAGRRWDDNPTVVVVRFKSENRNIGSVIQGELAA